MPRWTRYAVLACTVVIACLAAWTISAQAEKGLTVATDGLHVTITGPEPLLSRAAGIPGRPIAGCLYGVNWGDGQTSPQPTGEKPFCKDSLQHSYATPGRYEIRVNTYDPGPDDGPINPWKDRVTVELK